MTDRWKQILLKYKEWFVFTMVLCLVFCMFLWLSDIGSFYAILPSVSLAGQKGQEKRKGLYAVPGEARKFSK